MKIGRVTRLWRFCGGWFWHTACGILTLIFLIGAPGARAQSLNVVTSNETAPPGATVEIMFTLAQPAGVSSGELALNLDPTVFGAVTAIAAFSASGDAAGYASVSGNQVDIHFASQSASLGSAVGMPLVVITVPILATAKAGAQTAITANPTGSAWYGSSPEGAADAVSVTPGTVTVGGTLSVSGVSPVSNLAAAAAVRIMGTGFVSGTVVSIPAVSIASQQVIGPGEVDVTLAGPTDLGGKRITVTNPDGALVNFFAAPPAPPLASIGDPFDGAIPLLPTASYSAGSLNIFSLTESGRIVLANPGGAPVEALVEALSPDDTVVKQITVTVAAGAEYAGDTGSLGAGFGSSIQVLATGPLRMLSLLVNFGNPTAGPPSTTTYLLAPLNPIIPSPLGVYVDDVIQFSWVSGTASPQSQSLTVSGAAGVGFTVSFSTNSGGNWLSVTPTSGTTCNCSAQPTLTVSANPTGLAAGAYQGIITITPTGTQFQPAGPPVQIDVGLTVTNTPIVTQIVSGGFSAGPNAYNTLFSIAPYQLAGPLIVSVLTDSGGNWLSASPVTSTAGAEIAVTASPGNLGPGYYSGEVTVQGANGGTVVTPTTLYVSGSGAQLFPQNNQDAVFAMGPGEASPRRGPVARLELSRSLSRAGNFHA
jgi:hypothetical protein